MSGDRLVLLTPLRQALERIERKAAPLLADPALLDEEEGQDLLDVICMQFVAAVNGTVSSARRGWPVKAADSADTGQIGLAL
jgi:hypothetical protein